MAKPPRVICASDALAEGGKAVRFELEGAEALPCFAVRFDSGVHAYVNSCPHRGTELDWNPGEIFDDSGLYLICATHGAMFEPESGLCVAGPCKGAHLKVVEVVEENGTVLLPSECPGNLESASNDG